jgi:hypothetical protein
VLPDQAVRSRGVHSTTCTWRPLNQQPAYGPVFHCFRFSLCLTLDNFWVSHVAYGVWRYCSNDSRHYDVIFADHNTPSIPHLTRYRGLEYALKTYPLGHSDGAPDPWICCWTSCYTVFSLMQSWYCRAPCKGLRLHKRADREVSSTRSVVRVLATTHCWRQKVSRYNRCDGGWSERKLRAAVDLCLSETHDD